MVFNRNNRKEITAIEDLIAGKIYVNPTRYEELRQLQEDLWRPDAQLLGAPCTLLCLNPSSVVEDALQRLPGCTLKVERICDDPHDPAHKKDRKRFVKLFKQLGESGVGAFVHNLQSKDEHLTLQDKRVIALSLLARLPVICVATACPDPLPAASAASGNTWPVFFVQREEDTRPLCGWLSCELPRVRALSSRIESELQSRVAHLAEVNAPLHFLKRASVALVPFGVMTVNFLGILRLMAYMLQCVGMRGDSSARRAIGLLGAQNAALVTAADTLGDIYSFAMFTTVLADLKGLGLVEAATAMDVLDGLLLGSISVVTGAVSALAAYMSRPGVVRAAASFLASLQTIYVLNPDMRRPTERRERAKRRWRWGRRGRGDEERQALLEMGAVASAAASGDKGPKPGAAELLESTSSSSSGESESEGNAGEVAAPADGDGGKAGDAAAAAARAAAKEARRAARRQERERRAQEARERRELEQRAVQGQAEEEVLLGKGARPVSGWRRVLCCC